MTFSLVNTALLENNNLSIQMLYDVLTTLSERKLDYGDLYFQQNYHESWMLEDGIVKEGFYHIDHGVGARAVMGEKTGFAYADQITFDALMKSVDAAKYISTAPQSSSVKTLAQSPVKAHYAAMNPLASFSKEQKIDLLKQIDVFARQLDKRVVQVRASLAATYEMVLVAATDGTLATDIRPLVRLSVYVLAEQDGRREGGSYGGGARTNFDFFIEQENGERRVDFYVKEAVRLAILNLSAKAAPAGTLPVALGSGFSGVLLHEAVGHGLEGDFNRKKTSVFAGKLGEQVTSPLCTIVDDGTLVNRRGSLSIDDEGTPAQKNILIENGILKGYMQDKLNARLMGMAPTGNARRESYMCLPMPRMTNTYMLAGSSTREEIIESIDYGVYASMLAGGQVDITSGQFVFSTSEAYLIENGKIKHPIKGATLIGSGIDVMQNISMVGNDLDLDSGVGTCGKEGQSVPVGVGQPTIRVDKLTVGGTS